MNKVKSQHRFPWRMMGIVTLAICTSSLVYWFSCHVYGYELDHHSLTLRHFSFYRDPFTNHQWTGIKHQTVSWDEPYSPFYRPNLVMVIPSYAVDSPLGSTKKERWDLVSINQQKAHASILVDLLCTRDANYSFFWQQWSTKVPGQAKVFWPAMHDLCELGLYDELPHIFDIAATCFEKDDFRELLQAAMVEACLRLGERSEQLNEPQTVSLAAEVGLKYDSHPKFLSWLNRNPL
ncbi:MAG: hypothetical protein KDB03_05235 [Planctomycetales bacterium]|nr:hypothetical protein [Planctomycetales bacterium]